jgi:phosphoserine aminotransferase
MPPVIALKALVTSSLTSKTAISAVPASNAAAPAQADDAIREAVTGLRAFGGAAIPPADIADLTRRIGDIPGATSPG